MPNIELPPQGLVTTAMAVPERLVDKYRHRWPTDFDESLEAAVASIETVFGQAPGFVPFVRTLRGGEMRHFEINPNADADDWTEQLAELVLRTRAQVLTLGRSFLIDETDLGLDAPEYRLGLASVDAMAGDGRHEFAHCLVDIGGRAKRATEWFTGELSGVAQASFHVRQLRPALAALAANSK